MGKLVRDRIPEIMRADGKEPEIRVLDDNEYLASLLDKLVEEAQELREAEPVARLEEAADVYEVLAAITTQLGVHWSDVQRAASRNAADRGAFTGRIWLERW